MRLTKRNMPETMYRASRCCRILGNPTAYLLLRLLADKRQTPTELSKTSGASLTAVSFTLRHLRQIDLVRYETRGTSKEYWLKEKTVLKILDSLESWVDTLRTQQL